MPSRVVRLGETPEGNLLCIGFTPALLDHELSGLPQPYAPNTTEPDSWGWPSQQIFSSAEAGETILVFSAQSLATNALRNTSIYSDKRESLETDMRLAHTQLMKYAYKIARGLNRLAPPVWHAVEVSDDGNTVLFGDELPRKKEVVLYKAS
jgi:hypothetical protein